MACIVKYIEQILDILIVLDYPTLRSALGFVCKCQAIV